MYEGPPDHPSPPLMSKLSNPRRGLVTWLDPAPVDKWRGAPPVNQAASAAGNAVSRSSSLLASSKSSPRWPSMADSALWEWIRPAGARGPPDLRCRVLGRGKVAGGGRQKRMERAAAAEGAWRMGLGFHWMGMPGTEKGGGHG